MDMKQALFALSACTGPSGAEQGVCETASGILEPFVDSVTRDVMGHLIGIRAADTASSTWAQVCRLPRKRRISSLAVWAPMLMRLKPAFRRRRRSRSVTLSGLASRVTSPSMRTRNSSLICRFGFSIISRTRCSTET